LSAPQHASQAAALLRHLGNLRWRSAASAPIQDLEILADGVTARGVTVDAAGRRFEITVKRLEA
jgi:hypothetical protein